jgi:prolyl-tRNA editing enzyme YbaK/EbsC (Cys-tRNA(Pro) deacylase)
MSKSLKRVIRSLQEAGLEISPVETGAETRTAAQAADAVGCGIDQIAKSIVFRGAESGAVHLFVTAGGNRVDPDRAAQVAGEPLEAADAAFVRARTGFVIGGVSPVGHLTPGPVYFDPRLTDFTEIWAAAGTPRHVFPIDPARLIEISGAQLSDFTSK